MIKTKEKKERALGEQLELKGHRCSSPKCAAVRRPFRPGAHGHKRQRGGMSDFARQIKEKQKFKVSYGLNESGLRRLFEVARKKTASTSEELVRLLERRLDNVVFRLGFAPSRAAAKGLIRQGHIEVNGRRAHSPGLTVSKGDAVSIRGASRMRGQIAQAMGEAKERRAPTWLRFDEKEGIGKVVGDPEGEDIKTPFEVSLLIESFSK